LLAEARAALRDQQFDAALSALDLARNIDPAIPEVIDLTERVVREQATAQLNADLARTLAEIDERLNADDLQAAAELLRAATVLGEADTRVRAAHHRLEHAKSQRAAREAAIARERESEEKAAEAADLFQRGDLAGAERLLQSARRLNKDNPRVSLLAAQISDTIELRTAAEAAERARQKVGELVRAAAQQLQSANDQPPELILALSRIDEALALDPACAEALALRPAIETALELSREEAQVRAAVSNARRRFANGKHQAGLQLLESVQPSSHR
jgi:hypothetical protein